MAENHAECQLPYADYQEMLHHVTYARARSEIFCGRKAELTRVKKYLKQNDWISPLIVHAKAGEGGSDQRADLVGGSLRPLEAIANGF